MSEKCKQLLLDINNVSKSLSEEDIEKVNRVVISLLDIQLLQVLPKLTIQDLKDLDATEKLMLLKEYSKPEKQRKKELEEAIPLEDILKEEGLK